MLDGKWNIIEYINRIHKSPWGQLWRPPGSHDFMKFHGCSQVIPHPQVPIPRSSFVFLTAAAIFAQFTHPSPTQKHFLSAKSSASGDLWSSNHFDRNILQEWFTFSQKHSDDLMMHMAYPFRYYAHPYVHFTPLSTNVGLWALESCCGIHDHQEDEVSTCSKHELIQLWPEIAVVSTNKTPSVDCIIPLITSCNYDEWP